MGSLSVAGAISPAVALPTDDSEAEGRLISGGGVVDLNTIAALNPAYSASPSEPGEVVSPLSLEVLEALDIDLGDGIQLFGENGIIGVGALGQYANTAEGEVPLASSGAVNADGSIAIGGGGPQDNAYLDLTPLLGEAGLSDLLTQARVELGALSALATYDADGDVVSDYQIADGTMILQSDVLGDLVGDVTGALGPVSSAVNGLVGAEGTVNSALQPLLTNVQSTVNTVLLGLGTVNDLGVATSLDVDLEAAVQSVLGEPITSEDSAVTIDFSTGEISIDLARLVADSQGGDYDGTLNNLPPNTEVLGPDVIQAALDGSIGSIFDQLPALLVNAVTDALNAAELNIAITGEVLGLPPLNLPIGNLQINISGALGDFLGVEGSEDVDVNLDGTSVIGLEIGALLGPIVELATNTLLPALVTPISAAITDEGALDTIFRPLVEGVNELISPLAQLITENLVSLTANVQEDPGNFTTESAQDAGSFTQRSLQLSLLPGLATPLADVSLASATVRQAPDDGTDPDGTDPDGTDPDGTDPDGTDPDGTDPDGTDPDGTDPDRK
ncbi:choice-of-anchor G family protein, partial [Pseudactinotalea sp.]|uniref:choice-of-anchor G family protein n=1 Tax=Pseudactinotalea sp. TaxID=1926260 RepID=UPI003B3B62E8